VVVGVQPVIPSVYPIWIQKRDDFKDESFSENAGLFTLARGTIKILNYMSIRNFNIPFRTWED